MLQAFRNAFQYSRRGTQSTDVLSSIARTDEEDAEQSRKRSGVSRPLPPDLYHTLLTLINCTSSTPFTSIHEGVIGGNHYLSDTGAYVRAVDHDGVTYATATGSPRNSFLIFSTMEHGIRKLVAGRISEIFYHTRIVEGNTLTEPFLVINRFKTLSEDHAKLDPYLKFPDVPTWLCYNKLNEENELLCLEDIVSHFAAYVYTPGEIGSECIVVRSLDRVSSLIHSPGRCVLLTIVQQS